MARPSKNILSTRTIARAALALVESEGDFTIPGIAAALKVNASSLYHHLPGGRVEIVHRMREELYARIDLDPLRDASAPPSVRLRMWMQEVRAALAKVPAVVRVLVTSPVQDARTLELYETLFVILRDAGVPEHHRLPFATMVDAVVLGSAVDAGSPAPLWRPGDLAVPELRSIASADDENRAVRGFELAVDTVVDAVVRSAETAPAADRAL